MILAHGDGATRRVLIAAALLAAASLTPAPAYAQAAAFDCRLVSEYPTCAAGVGTVAGRIAASALACGLPRERWMRVGSLMAEIIADVALDEDDRLDGMRRMRLAGEETLRRRESGEDGEPCDSIARRLERLAQDLGVAS